MQDASAVIPYLRRSLQGPQSESQQLCSPGRWRPPHPRFSACIIVFNRRHHLLPPLHPRPPRKGQIKHRLDTTHLPPVHRSKRWRSALHSPLVILSCRLRPFSPNRSSLVTASAPLLWYTRLFIATRLPALPNWHWSQHTN